MPSSLGTAKTGKFAIGTAELRVGPLTSAGKLSKEHSVGLIDAATLNVEQTSVDLNGGFPQVIQATAITNQTAQITATLREFSRRNLGILLGQGLLYPSNDDSVNDAKTTLSAPITAGNATIALTATTGFAAGDWVTIYDPADPAVCAISKLSSTTALDANFLTPVGFASGAVISKLAPIAVGAVEAVSYFSAQLVTLDRATGRPKIANLWKVAVGAGMSLANNATDFASTELNLKVLRPTLADYGSVGSPLYHLNSVISAYPMGLMGELSDDATS